MNRGVGLVLLTIVSLIWLLITFKYFSSGVYVYSAFGSQIHWASLLLLLGLFVLGFFFGKLVCSTGHNKKNVSSHGKKDNFDFSQIDNTANAPQKDNLKAIEGIGPKLEELLNKNNIVSFEDLSEANLLELETIIATAGNKFAMHNPKTWPEQAKLAKNGKWDELKEYQNFLYRGLDS